MRLPCPFCGPRDSAEFAYLGDAAIARPDAAAPDAPRLFYEATYLRDNPAGPHREHWYHAAGCRQWLVVTRDTTSHEILAAAFARQP
ncbi:sarcosine oxidase subunit delta [Zavarzinia compransoris]|uniref:Sarcosine oxidase subunit delta n=1 Tax=Zavarzinia compransoris TaxID=1264899 RepID=A0A317E3M2_9PROT|nr:sarcosine oxidase subunit delta [Zavarzinia compransoris]PWR19665.1 sarcosine oxidase subunit delta [Zavarzinia compransoris]TDP43393.1 N-methylglutamate dehydrogenase subunit B [Zavarzinia compransoris]